ncbi:hypothetical protein HYR99_19080 [Candidatus Poribacteria bacterium]|nr:hypothetical protein [Candidatus Poribacteria bacterium]
MRRHKPLDALNPIVQCEPIELSDDLLKVVNQVQAEIEAKYQTEIDQISDEDEREMLNRLYELSMERFRASPGYDPERGKKLVEELINTVPYHKSLRYGKMEVVDGQLVPVTELERLKRSERRGEARGKRLGVLHAKREDLLRILHIRFDVVPEPVVKKVKSIRSLNHLNALLEKAITDKNISELELD